MKDWSEITSEVAQRFQIICSLFWFENKEKLELSPLVDLQEMWHDEQPLTHDILTSVRLCARLCLAALRSRHVCPGVTLFVTTASLCNLNAFAPELLCGHRCWDGRWCISGCGRDHVIWLAERTAMFGAAPGSHLILWRWRCRCPDWPEEGGHSLNMLVRTSSWQANLWLLDKSG